MSPSTVRGISRPVQPDSPCARTRALACSYDTTEATAATPTTASAVEHLMIRSAAIIERHLQAQTRRSKGMSEGFLVQSVLGHSKFPQFFVSEHDGLSPGRGLPPAPRRPANSFDSS